MKKVISKGMIGSLMAVAMLSSVTANAAPGGNGGTPLPAIDSVVSTTFDKSVIHGSLAHDENGNLLYDDAGNSRFVYEGKIYAIETDDTTGELIKMSDDPIGDISGEAAFPKDFVALSAGVNALMGMMQAYKDETDASDEDVFEYIMPYMPQMPAIVPWTCNHCDMTVGGTRYVSIVDALDIDSPFYSAEMAAKLDMGVMGDETIALTGSQVALNTMRMDGRAFTGLTPATFDYASRTMGVRMAGCSALVAIEGPKAGKVGTLCMNATAVFDVSEAIAIFDEVTMQLTGYEQTSQISAEGSSNCVTVLHTPTM